MKKVLLSQQPYPPRRSDAGPHEPAPGLESSWWSFVRTASS